jgi:hypothetical protein
MYFYPYLNHDLTDFATLPPATPALHTMSIWLQSATNVGLFAYIAYCLFAYICASIPVIFLKIYFWAQTGVSLLIFE